MCPSVAAAHINHAIAVRTCQVGGIQSFLHYFSLTLGQVGLDLRLGLGAGGHLPRPAGERAWRRENKTQQANLRRLLTDSEEDVVVSLRVFPGR